MPYLPSLAYPGPVLQVPLPVPAPSAAVGARSGTRVDWRLCLKMPQHHASRPSPWQDPAIHRGKGPLERAAAPAAGRQPYAAGLGACRCRCARRSLSTEQGASGSVGAAPRRGFLYRGGPMHEYFRKTCALYCRNGSPLGFMRRRRHCWCVHYNRNCARPIS